ncbi:MAG: aldose 1-epimerase family protein, partial [Candidatus Omnitrophica bacterium]|nr:aldose 1-epimerase family protein [Candidatus Omnitrophota bacterium]
MANIFAKKYTREEIHTYTGSLRQIGGIARSQLSEGPGKGMEIATLRTGSGFDLTLLMDRGMDISTASYRGVPLNWSSPSGDAHPNRFDPHGLGWLRTFPGGLLVTCGLRQTGSPCEDEGEALGLHGRYTSLPAERICHTEGWEGDDYVMRLSGEMREAVIFGENLVLHREYRAILGEPRITLTDTVTNEGSSPSPHMILYHCNFGFPLLSPGTELSTPHAQIEPRNPDLEDPEGPLRFTEPISGYQERVYYHLMETDAEGYVSVRLKNPSIDGGLTFTLEYRHDQLPHFTQWKMMGKRDYVCGLEPGNARVEGRAKER